jgi:hypothetical protein
MPKDFSKGKIYKIVCGVTGEIYVGSTTKEYLSQRLTTHKKTMKDWKKGTAGFVSSYPILERDNYRIELIESYPCQCWDELMSREGYWIKQIICVNQRVAGRTRAEYRQDNAEKLRQITKEWREANPEKARAGVRAYQESHKEEIQANRKVRYQENADETKAKAKAYREANPEKEKETKKKYQESHREELKAKKKAYYEKNKEAIIAKNKAYRDAKKAQ